MTDTERAELKRLAEKATPGPWNACLCGGEQEGWVANSTGHIMTTGYEGEMSAADVRYIAAANPAAVLDLLKEHEEDQGVIAVWRGRTHRAEAEVERLRDLLRRAAGVFRDMAGMPMEADLLEAQVEEDT